LAINKYFSIISQGEAPGNRLVPGGGLAIMESYSQWKQTPRKRQEAKHTPALGKKLALITELFCPYMEAGYSRFQRENREGRDREEGLSAPLKDTVSVRGGCIESSVHENRVYHVVP